MINIEKIQALDLDKIDNGAIKQEIDKLLKEYQASEDKKDFVEATSESTALIMEMITDLFPGAIQKETPCDDTLLISKQTINKVSSKTASKAKGPIKSLKRDKNTPSKKKDKTSLKLLEDLQKEVEECRKRGASRKNRKMTPSIPKTIYDKIYSHLNAIANLFPDRFREDEQKVAQLKRVSLGTHKKLVSLFEMNEALAEKGRSELKQKFKKMNLQFKTQNNDGE